MVLELVDVHENHSVIGCRDEAQEAIVEGPLYGRITKRAKRPHVVDGPVPMKHYRRFFVPAAKHTVLELFKAPLESSVVLRTEPDSEQGQVPSTGPAKV